MKPIKGPTTIGGQRIVRLREIRTRLPYGMVLLTWGVFDLHAGSRAHPLHAGFLSRKVAARVATREGWRYIGPQEAES